MDAKEKQEHNEKRLAEHHTYSQSGRNPCFEGGDYTSRLAVPDQIFVVRG